MDKENRKKEKMDKEKIVSLREWLAENGGMKEDLLATFQLSTQEVWGEIAAFVQDKRLLDYYSEKIRQFVHVDGGERSWGVAVLKASCLEAPGSLDMLYRLLVIPFAALYEYEKNSRPGVDPGRKENTKK